MVTSQINSSYVKQTKSNLSYKILKRYLCFSIFLLSSICLNAQANDLDELLSEIKDLVENHAGYVNESKNSENVYQYNFNYKNGSCKAVLIKIKDIIYSKEKAERRGKKGMTQISSYAFNFGDLSHGNIRHKNDGKERAVHGIYADGGYVVTHGTASGELLIEWDYLNEDGSFKKRNVESRYLRIPFNYSQDNAESALQLINSVVDHCN